MIGVVTITVKLTPSEWDAVREACAFAQENAESVANDKNTDVRMRHDARKNATLLADLRRKFA